MEKIIHDGYGTIWYSKENEPLWCYIGLGEESLLENYEIIKENMEDEQTSWTQFEISFDKNGKLREFHYLVFDDNDNGDCDLIGREIMNGDKIVGHTLLTDDEFNQVLSKAKEEFNKETIDWNYWINYIKGGN